MARVIELEVQNIKRVKAVRVAPRPGVTRVGGRNAQGKTSVLDAIEMALAGARRIPEMPVRVGQDRGKVEITLDNGITIRRDFEDGKSRLIVSDSTGRIKSPQTFLDEITGKGIAFDPLAFLRMDPSRQLATLQRLVGLEFDDIDAEISRLDSERALAGRDVTGRQTQIDTMPQYSGVPSEEVSASKLSDELSAALEANAAIRQLQDAASLASGRLAEEQDRLDAARELARLAAERVARYQDEMASKPSMDDLQSEKYTLRKTIESTQAKIKALQEVLALKLEAEAGVSNDIAELSRLLETREAASSRAQELSATVDTQASEVLRLKANEAALLAKVEEAGAPVDVEPMRLAISEAEAVNKKIRANAERTRLVAQFREAKAAYEDYCDQITELVRKKAAAINAAEMPVRGLGIGKGIVTYQGVPLSQASSAEQYKVSTAMGLEVCPQGKDGLRIGLIRDGSLLDADSMAAITETAEKYDADLWIEVVTDLDDEGRADVIIEDGESREPITKGGK